MYFTKLLFFITFTSAASVNRAALPNGQTTVQDIIKINNAVIALDKKVQAYKGAPPPTSIVNGTPILEGVARIHNVNREGFAHALEALPFTHKASVDVINTVVQTVNISIPIASKHLEEKLPAFKESGFVPVVIASLGLLLSDHDTYSAAVFTKLTGLTEKQTTTGFDAVANIQESIQNAILYYTENGA